MTTIYFKTDILREAPTEMLPLLFGHCPFGGGGLDPCQDGLGHLFREEQSYSNWSENKVPQSARLSAGGGGQSQFGQCPNRSLAISVGASLSAPNHPGKHFDPPTIKQMPI